MVTLLYGPQHGKDCKLRIYISDENAEQVRGNHT
jgi:hypothetical protein